MPCICPQVTTSPSISKASEPAMEESDDEQQMQIGQSRVGDILTNRVRILSCNGTLTMLLALHVSLMQAMDSVWIKQDDLVLDAVRKVRRNAFFACCRLISSITHPMVLLQMAQSNVGSLLVCDEAKMKNKVVAADAVIGIITERGKEPPCDRAVVVMH